ncbi:MAG: hypothetical protein IJZ42_07140 [Lachnospiraceae bacterium]|nr:hypothetical protein [Lachnospiraceae bacterium]
MYGIKQFVIYSEKYDIKGVIHCLADIAAVEFIYDKNYYNCQIEGEWSESDGERIKAQGLKALEEHMVRVLAGEVEARKVRLYNWVLQKAQRSGREFVQACGNVTGHYEVADSEFIYTSEIESIEIDEENEEAIICTRHTRYFCRLDSLVFKEQDTYPEAIPNYKALKEKYAKKKDVAPIEDGNILLQIANYAPYYFHNLYYKPVGTEAPAEYKAFPHVGTFQDSFLIWVDEGEIIDLRYFPHPGNIEFYVQGTNEKPWFVENVGDTTLYAKTFAGTIKLDPGERKEVKEDNAEEERVDLPGGDLYPAEFIN